MHTPRTSTITVPHRPGTERRRWLGWLCAAALLCPHTGHAQGVRFDVPPQSLGSALDSLAREAGLQILYPPEAVEGLTTRGVQGEYTPREAIQRLLDGTGLRYEFLKDNTVTVSDAVKENDAPPVKEPDPEDQIVTLPEMTVTASPLDDTSYNPPNATTATKTDTPIMETPASIQVIPQQVLKDQQAFRLGQALRNVSGVRTFSNQGSHESFVLRGFSAGGITGASFLRNGARIGTGQGNQGLANVERVEVLKGPASILYGRLEPGGIINVVTKQPTAEPYYALEQQFGSDDFYRTHADAGGPLSEDGRLGYRFNLAYEDAGSFREFVNTDALSVAPMLRWDLSERTWASLELEYGKETIFFDQGISPGLPRERNLGEPNEGVPIEHIQVDFDLSHAFNDRWSVRHHFHYRRQDDDFTEQVDVLGAETCTPADCPVERQLFSGRDLKHIYSTSLDLTGKFETWGIGHTLLMGGDLFWSDAEDDLGFAPFPSIDLFRPVHTGIPSEIREEVRRNRLPFFSQTTELYGLYLQDQMALPFNLHFLGGFRYDHTRDEETVFDTPFSEAGTTENTASAITPRYGLLWRPLPELSFYGSYVENFGQPTGRQFADNTPLKPETAQEWEVGVKTELLDGRLTGSLAYYDLTKQNVVVPDLDPGLAALGFVRQVGEINHGGIELDIAGEVLPGWRLIGAYSYLDSEITRDSDNLGNRLAGAPRHLGSFFSIYEVQQGPFRGLSVGGGITTRDQLEANDENTAQHAGYVLVNLAAGYSTTIGGSELSFQVNADNVADKTIFEGGPPLGRTVLGSVRVEF